MGYMGFGMQRWISNMKPRKFLGKRNKPDGGGNENIAGRDIKDYYQLKPNKLNRLLQKKYSGKYREKLSEELNKESKKQNIYYMLSLIIALVVVFVLLSYLAKIFQWF